MYLCGVGRERAAHFPAQFAESGLSVSAGTVIRIDPLSCPSDREGPFTLNQPLGQRQIPRLPAGHSWPIAFQRDVRIPAAWPQPLMTGEAIVFGQFRPGRELVTPCGASGPRIDERERGLGNGSLSRAPKLRLEIRSAN